MSRSNDKLDISSSLDKGLTLLLELANNAEEMGITELSNKTLLPVSTISRILTTLVRRGFVIQNPTSKKYGIGFVLQKFMNIGNNKTILKNISQKILVDLRDSTGETALIYVRNGLYREHVFSIESLQELKTTSPVNNLAPLYTGSASRVLWAFDSDDKIIELLDNIELTRLTDKTICDKAALLNEAALIRTRGYAVSHGERNKGVGGISAPVFGFSGAVIAAVSVSFPMTRFDNKLEEKIVPQVLQAAKKISHYYNLRVN